MKLRAERVPYSSVVGGGVMLLDEGGAVTFQIALIGTRKGISKEQTDAIGDRLVALINEHGMDAP